MRVSLNIEGHPMPKGSLKCVGGGRGFHQLVEDDKTGRLKAWRAACEAEARRVCASLQDLIDSKRDGADRG